MLLNQDFHFQWPGPRLKIESSLETSALICLWLSVSGTDEESSLSASYKSEISRKINLFEIYIFEWSVPMQRFKKNND